MLPPRPVKPETLEAPGLNWRARSNAWVAYWLPRADIVERGYPQKSVRLWPPTEGHAGDAPTPEQWTAIGSLCSTHQAEMLGWANGAPLDYDPRALYRGTLASLINIYQVDPDSPYKSVRFHTRTKYDRILAALAAAVGNALVQGPDPSVSSLTFRDFLRWHEGFKKPVAEGAPIRRARGHEMMTFVRMVISFGALLKLPGCADARATLADMEFEAPKKRQIFMTAEQAVLHRRAARARGFASMSMAQALMYELMARPKDVVGEKIPISEPGISAIVYAGMKWMHGIQWQEIGADFILTHRLSKSLRGRNATLDPDAGKTEGYPLLEYPMIVEELCLLAGVASAAELRRDMFPASGPMIVFENTGRPWDHKYFSKVWREVADVAGIPKRVQNRDSRAGGITEGRRAGVPIGDLRHHAGHSRTQTTEGYDRSDVTDKAKVAQLRVKNRPETP